MPSIGGKNQARVPNIGGLKRPILAVRIRQIEVSALPYSIRALHSTTP